MMRGRRARHGHDRRDVPRQQVGRYVTSSPTDSSTREFANRTCGRVRGRSSEGRRAKPIVDIYSTFSAAQPSIRFSKKSRCKICPSRFMLDRAGLAGPDGPTHHGVFDYQLHATCSPTWSRWLQATRRTWHRDAGLRIVTHDGPTSIRYPKATSRFRRSPETVQLRSNWAESRGHSRPEADGTILCLRSASERTALQAAQQLGRRRRLGHVA